MEQLIEAFGIDLKLIVIQVINFTVLVALLSYFLYGPILRILKERKEKIEQGLADAKAAADAKVTADAEKATVLASAHEEAAAVAARAKAHAEALTASELASAQAKGEQVIVAAGIAAQELKQKAHKESEAEIAKLAVLAAEKILRERAS
jgi:F-type H+-transporting ATPase subunit b